MPYQHFDSDTEDSADRNPIEVVAEEFLECHRRGENPDAEAFADRHPQLAEEIRDAAHAGEWATV